MFGHVLHKLWVLNVHVVHYRINNIWIPLWMDRTKPADCLGFRVVVVAAAVVGVVVVVAAASVVAVVIVVVAVVETVVVVVVVVGGRRLGSARH